MLGPLFLVSGVSTGAALMMLLPMKHEEHAMIQRWDVGAILIEAILLFLFLITLLTGGGRAGSGRGGAVPGRQLHRPVLVAGGVCRAADPLRRWRSSRSSNVAVPPCWHPSCC